MPTSPAAENPEARLQGMSVAADLYILVGEYDLALRYADQVIKENANGRGICRGGQIRLDALCKKGRLRSDDPGPNLLPAARKSPRPAISAWRNRALAALATALLVSSARCDCSGNGGYIPPQGGGTGAGNGGKVDDDDEPSRLAVRQ